MKNKLKISKITYLSVSALVYLIVAIIFRTFYVRKSTAVNYRFNPSYIEQLPDIVYIIALLLCSIIVLLLIFTVWGMIKQKKFAHIFYVLFFIFQTLFTGLAGLALKSIEGVYFWQSSYVQKYLLFAGIIALITLLVTAAWLFEKIKNPKKVQS